MTFGNSIRKTMLAACMIASSLGATSAFGQTTVAKLNGSYVFTEEGLSAFGQSITAIANLAIADTGAITGSEIIQTANATTAYDVLGTYTSNSDGTETLALMISSTDADGNAISQTENFRLIAAPSGDRSAVRVDPGFYTTSKLLAAGPQLLKGKYVLAERVNNRPIARLAMINFDGTGAVSGFEIVQSLGVANRLNLTGTAAKQSNGFQTLNLLVDETDDNGNTFSSSERYLFINTKNDIRMLRTDSGSSGIFVLTQ